MNAPSSNVESVELLKQTLSPGTVLTDAELALFAEVCKRTRLDPFRKQIYAIKRNTKVKRWRNGVQVEEWEARLTFQTSIDGFRSIAVRSGAYTGTRGPFWCGADGVWKDVWLASSPPAASKVGVCRVGCEEPIWGVARFDAYTQGGNMWQRMADTMIAKCAEALALRRAFPDDLGGLYTDDEMAQADREPEEPPVRQLGPYPQERPAPPPREPAKRPSSPPPANDTGPGVGVERQGKERQEAAAQALLDAMGSAQSVAELTRVWSKVKDASAKGVITLDQRAQLSDASKARKAFLDAPPPPPPHLQHPPEDDFPPSYNRVAPGPEEADSPPPPDWKGDDHNA